MAPRSPFYRWTWTGNPQPLSTTWRLKCNCFCKHCARVTDRGEGALPLQHCTNLAKDKPTWSECHCCCNFLSMSFCLRPHAVGQAGGGGGTHSRSVTSRGYMILKWFPASSLQLKVAVGALMGTATENKDCGKFGALLALRSVHAPRPTQGERLRHHRHLVTTWLCSVRCGWST